MADPYRSRRRVSGSDALRLSLLIAAALAVLVVIAAFMVGPNLRTWYRGMAYDSPYYLWRTNLVSASGVGSLGSVPLSGAVVNPDRPGFPVVASLVGSAVRVDPWALVRAVQVATTLAIALAAGAFALDILEEPRWSFPLYVLVMGMSAQVARTSIGSLDNLLVDAVLVAVAVAAVGSLGPGRGRAAAIAGLAAAALIHWFFCVLFILLMAGFAASLIPWSITARRRGTRLSQTPAVAMGIIVVGGGVAAAAALFGLAPAMPARLPPVHGDKGNQTRLPYFRLPITGPIAALGAVSLWRPNTTNLKRRTGSVLLVLWAITVLVAQLVAKVTGRPVKVFRVGEFDLAIPLLCAAALVGVVSLGKRFGAIGKGTAVIVVAAGLLVLMSIGVTVYRTPESGASASRLEQVRSVADYVRTIPPDRPVVFLSTLAAPNLAYRTILAGLPGDRIGRTYLYMGDMKDLLAGRPGAPVGNAVFDRRAADWWDRAWDDAAEILNSDPVIVYLEAFNGVETPLPTHAKEVAPGALVLNGPTAEGSGTPIRVDTTPGPMALRVVCVLFLLGVVGSGWTRWLLPVGTIGWVAISPAVGIGASALVGTAAGKVGAPAGGTGGLVVVISIAALGWLALWSSRLLGSAKATSPEREGDIAESHRS